MHCRPCVLPGHERPVTGGLRSIMDGNAHPPPRGVTRRLRAVRGARQPPASLRRHTHPTPGTARRHPPGASPPGGRRRATGQGTPPAPPRASTVHRVGNVVAAPPRPRPVPGQTHRRAAHTSPGSLKPRGMEDANTPTPRMGMRENSAENQEAMSTAPAHPDSPRTLAPSTRLARKAVLVRTSGRAHTRLMARRTRCEAPTKACASRASRRTRI